jgi:hypothetical protein
MDAILLGLSLLGAAVFSAVFGFLVKQYLPAYFSEKGKNLATKEDIAEITRLIEGVKTSFAHELEGVRAQIDRYTSAHSHVPI